MSTQNLHYSVTVEHCTSDVEQPFIVLLLDVPASQSEVDRICAYLLSGSWEYNVLISLPAKAGWAYIVNRAGNVKLLAPKEPTHTAYIQMFDSVYYIDTAKQLTVPKLRMSQKTLASFHNGDEIKETLKTVKPLVGESLLARAVERMSHAIDADKPFEADKWVTVAEFLAKRGL